jgi:hypothetical protein
MLKNLGFSDELLARPVKVGTCLAAVIPDIYRTL